MPANAATRPLAWTCRAGTDRKNRNSIFRASASTLPQLIAIIAGAFSAERHACATTSNLASSPRGIRAALALALTRPPSEALPKQRTHHVTPNHDCNCCFAFVRSSNLIALVTDTGATVLSRRCSSSNRTAPHAVQCRRRQPENEPTRILWRRLRWLLRWPLSPVLWLCRRHRRSCPGCSGPLAAAAIGTGAAYNNYYASSPYNNSYGLYNNAGYGNGYYDDHGRYWSSYYNQDYWNAFQ